MSVFHGPSRIVSGASSTSHDALFVGSFGNAANLFSSSLVREIRAILMFFKVSGDGFSYHKISGNSDGFAEREIYWRDCSSLVAQPNKPTHKTSSRQRMNLIFITASTLMVLLFIHSTDKKKQFYFDFAPRFVSTAINFYGKLSLPGPAECGLTNPARAGRQ